jgi:hypothetical protein
MSMSQLRGRSLPDGVSLEVLREDTVVYRSMGKWLHPLLEVESFLESNKIDASELVLHDTIAGRAAAALMIRMGFTKVKARMMSQSAVGLFDMHGVSYCYDVLVERIACKTEELINSSMDLDEIHRMILERAKASKPVSFPVE